MADTIKAVLDHNGRFGVIKAGVEYDPEDPLIRKCLQESPVVFKKNSKRGSKTVETASATNKGKETR